MKTLMLVILIGLGALMALKVLGALLGILIPLALVAAVLAVPVGLVVLVGWVVVTLFDGSKRAAGREV